MERGTPLGDAVDRYLADPGAPFTTPGHKRAPDIADGLLLLDAPLAGGVDDLQLSRGFLRRAEAMAAELWGADLARFSVAGSSHGNQAMVLGMCRPGDRVGVSRNMHKSLLSGLILAGAEPVWIVPDIDPATGLPLGYPAAAVDAALDAGVRAIFLVNPTFVGVMTPLGPIVEAAHARGVPVAVDQAWGAHLGLDPRLPPHALAEGADAMVVSVHKTLTGFTQSALLLARSGVADVGRIEAAFELGHTTSPSAAILASTDRARALVESRGDELFGRALANARFARDELARIAGVAVLDDPVTGASPGGLRLDPLKLVVGLAGTGGDGFAVERRLIRAGVRVELADRDTLIPLLTIGDDRASVERLVRELAAAVEAERGEPRPVGGSTVWRLRPQPAASPREAFFAPQERIPARSAAGRISAETVALYPPGIPAICPGEVVTADLVADLQAEARRGARLAYCGDPTLETIAVVA